MPIDKRLEARLMRRSPYKVGDKLSYYYYHSFDKKLRVGTLIDKGMDNVTMKIVYTLINMESKKQERVLLDKITGKSLSQKKRSLTLNTKICHNQNTK